MSNRRVLGFVSIIALASGCDALKHTDADAGVVVATPVAPTTAATPATPAPPVTTVAPLGGPVAPTPAGGVKPAADGGKPVATDAGAAAADAGKAAPAPTPTFAIPTAIPGFDAGAFKPPPGFPSTIPTFPQPPPSATR